MKKFYKEVAPQRSAREEFLREHGRYYTLNPWNKLHSYANRLKIYDLELPEEIQDKAYEVICLDEFYDRLNFIIAEWRENNPGYEVFFNGRPAEYMVLCSEGTNVGIDQDGNFDDKDDDVIKEHVEIVQSFDKLCDNCVEELVYLCRNFDVVGETMKSVDPETTVKPAWV